MSQCMHDGRSGPCERIAAPAEFFCRKHMPKVKKEARYVNVSESYGDRVEVTMKEFQECCSLNGWTLPMLREGPGGSLVSATTGETILVPVIS